jgi:hypothetical protein
MSNQNVKIELIGKGIVKIYVDDVYVASTYGKVHIFERSTPFTTMVRVGDYTYIHANEIWRGD